MQLAEWGAAGSAKVTKGGDGKTETERGTQTVLKCIECPANEHFVRHLDLLSFLLQLNVKSWTRRSEVLHPKQGENDHAKVSSWAFKQAANVIRRLPGTGLPAVDVLISRLPFLVADALCRFSLPTESTLCLHAE